MLGDLFGSSLDQQTDFPMAGVITEGHGRAVWISDAPLSAEDQILIAQHTSRIETHADALGQTKQIAAAPITEDFVAQRQFAAGALGMSAKRVGRR